MKEIRITLPEALANQATEAGLLAPEAVEAMLRTMLKARAESGLKTLFSALDDPLSAAQEAEIIDEVRKVRAQRKAA